MVKRIAITAFGWLALCSGAMAHPGHGQGGGDFSLRHYLTEPVHLVFAVAIALTAAAAVRGALTARRRSSARRGR